MDDEHEKAEDAAATSSGEGAGADDGLRPAWDASVPGAVPALRRRQLAEGPLEVSPPTTPGPEASGAAAVPDVAVVAERRRRRDMRQLVVAAAAGVLVLAAGWFAYASHSNEAAASEWRQRAIELDEQVSGLRTLIGERSAQLNVRTRQANRLASNLRSTRLALERSEGDVTSLARRQRELANEKAQLEDQRRALQQQASALEDVASRYIDCKDSLIDVISSLVYDDYTTASYQIDIARGRCNSAADALSAYLAAYS